MLLTMCLIKGLYFLIIYAIQKLICQIQFISDSYGGYNVDG